jgi:hypothetical protein
LLTNVVRFNELVVVGFTPSIVKVIGLNPFTVKVNVLVPGVVDNVAIM